MVSPLRYTARVPLESVKRIFFLRQATSSVQNLHNPCLAEINLISSDLGNIYFLIC